MRQQIEEAVAGAVQELFGVSVKTELTRTEERFGDYATNVALQLARKVGKNPREVAEALAEKLRQTLGDVVLNVSVADPGFLNLTLSDAALVDELGNEPAKILQDKNIVAEYSDPNPFKVLHAGHLYTSVVGDNIANLLERVGATVHRVNFGGDVGLHVGKTMWAILQELSGENPEKLTDIQAEQRAEWMSRCYVAGTNAYEDDEAAKAKIIELNK